MKEFFQPYQHANNNSKKRDFNQILFFLLCIVHFTTFAQSTKINPNGYNTFYFPSGLKSSEGTLENGKPNGYWKTYHENGQLKSEGNRKAFMLDSLWKFFDDKGHLHTTIYYEKELKNGPTTTYDTLGNVKEITFYKNNIKSGEGKVFYKNGQIHWLDTYVDDKKEGLSYEYDSTGMLITIREYTAGFLRNEETINRYDKEGNKQGVWKEFFDDGKVKWEGKYAGGKLDGVVKEYNQKGGLKQLEKFDMGIADEKSEDIQFFELTKQIRPDGSMLVGGFTDGKKQGVFRAYDSLGNLMMTYSYKNDIKTAEGMIDSLGNKIGEWLYFYETGELMVKGMFVNGIREKEWLFYYKDGTLQQKGNYSAGKPQGLWKWWYPNKQLLREETFRKGKEDGEVIEYDSLGNVITHGEFVDGMREGKWYYNVNDHTEEGEFRDNERHGLWTYKYHDGKTAFSGEYMNGMPTGKHKYFHSNGQLHWVGKYRNGLKDGEWIKYTEEGVEEIVIEYKLGVEIKVGGYKIKPGMLE